MLYVTRGKPKPDPNDPTQLLSIADVKRKTQIGETKLRKMIMKGEFPRPSKINNRLVFLQEQVDQWIRDQFPNR